MADYIKKGDRVNVYWEHIEAEHNLTVVYTPQSELDTYICRRKDGSLVHIGTFGKMEQVID